MMRAAAIGVNSAAVVLPLIIESLQDRDTVRDHHAPFWQRRRRRGHGGADATWLDLGFQPRLQLKLR
jgi:hypothetical protein